MPNEGSWDKDPVRHGRLTAIEGRVDTRPCKAKNKTFYFVYPDTATFVPDTEKYPLLGLIHLRVNIKKSLIFKEKTLD